MCKHNVISNIVDWLGGYKYGFISYLQQLNQSTNQRYLDLRFFLQSILVAFLAIPDDLAAYAADNFHLFCPELHV
jgi:hypothetical protein